MATRKPKASDLVQKSPAEFFAENKNIAGFDNPGKCLYTTVRELVENALDSSESMGVLPVIDITIEEVPRTCLNEIRGLEHQERLDEQLYQDYETEDQKRKRLAKEAREAEKVQKSMAKKAGDGGAAAGSTSAAGAKKPEAESAAAPKTKPSTKANTFYKVTVKDNGTGMPHKDIPNMLGRVLSGTKYGVKQVIGQDAQTSCHGPSNQQPPCTEGYWALQTCPMICAFLPRNEPNVHKEEQLPNTDGWHGAQLSLTIEGNWSTYRSKIIKYLRQIAVITPYAEFQFFYKSAVDDKSNTRVVFRRRTDVVPAPPREVKHHPSSVDLELIKRLISITKADTLVKFLIRDFDCITKDLAERLVEEMRSGVAYDTHPSELNSKQIVRLHELLHAARFPDPKGSHLSPAGEYNLRLGVMKELRPELIATYQGDVRVFEGHAFMVEAAVSIGGRDARPGITAYRFANRIPLLFEGGSDVITKTANKRINWGSYKINSSSDKVGVFVSIVSTKIPFKGAGKEYIGDDIEEMVGAVKQAIQACCVQVGWRALAVGWWA
ncbi:topoisomerase VI B subunit, transducer-domain-containing protein [Dunaliella salina]|uniref:Topoisomerase VI B subunit, transducer-domain-containing protein n=1 Tax=Dunaliella salina TaxID=3046 RepID=A0ABQ7G3Q0_DUNSA|nr:topoisomerase VI B subunit, transducer-domain-containing protein [Dunaliella salina]|eukprot:KAF5829235.1 topoisomerase VI B subunit, transducer-domain-containing protein [Dunaliella salina]